MNLLTQTVRICRNNVGHLRVPPVAPSIGSIRSLSTSQWKKYLTILDLTKESTTKEIKDSFLKLSKVYHPDNKVTGSHTKFVELKEAYDALKDGHPTTTAASASSTYTSANRYNNYYDTDPTWQAHRDYRDRYREYPYSQNSYGFGGPYRNSSTPWEDMRRDQEYRRQKSQYNSYKMGKGRGLVNVTIILSTMAWIVIYSSVLLIWDYNSNLKKELLNTKTRYDDQYMQYQDYLRKKELARVARDEHMRSTKSREENADKHDYISSNNQSVLKMIRTKTTSPSHPLPSTQPLSALAPTSEPTLIDLKPSSASHPEPEVVGAL